MSAGADDPSARRSRRAGIWLALVEASHYVWAGLVSTMGLAILVGPVLMILQRLGNWGVVSKWDVYRALPGLAVMAYVGMTICVGRCIGRRTHRRLTLFWQVAHLLTVLGIPVALMTWLTLTRRAVRDAYESVVLPFEPRMLPPPLPVPAILLTEVEEDPRCRMGCTNGRRG